MFAAMLYHRAGENGVTVSLQPNDEVIETAKQNLTADGLKQALQMGKMMLVKGDEKSGTGRFLLKLSIVIKLG